MVGGAFCDGGQINVKIKKVSTSKKQQLWPRARKIKYFLHDLKEDKKKSSP